jgi:divalent metal cation (Fe/Co/Zn/Cd) transporter
LIGASFYVIAAYIAVEAIRTLAGGGHPEASYVGIALAAVTLATMPPLAAAKARVGEKLHSSATKSEGRQNLLCAYLSAALLIGLGANALLGWWWADPITALVIAAVAVNEGRAAWRGEACDDCC